jgi:formylglycine-generating enzyme required for sulfatase activity
MQFLKMGGWIAVAAVLLLLSNKIPGTSRVAAQDSTAVPTEAATTATIAPITKNADWTPQSQDFGGVTMALVPPGCFVMGADDGLDDEKPATKMCFDAPFWIDKTEVTQANSSSLVDRQQFHPGLAAITARWSRSPGWKREISAPDARRDCQLKPNGSMPRVARMRWFIRGAIPSTAVN